MQIRPTLHLGQLLFVFLMSLTVFAQTPRAAAESSLPSASLMTEGEKQYILIGRKRYQVNSGPLNPEWAEIYASLPPEQQEAFTEKRAAILKSLAQILSQGKIVFGIGSLTTEKTKNAAKQSYQFVKLRFQKSDTQTPELNIPEEVTLDKDKRTVTLRGQEIVEAILESVNQRLWSQTPLISHINEVGGNIELDIGALGGIREKGWGGYLGLGISFGYNKEQRAFIFQFYGFKERYVNSAAAAMVLAVGGKAGIYFADNNPLEAPKSLKSDIFYPPGVPGYEASNSHRMSTGLSSSLGWPPPPFGDMLTYSTKAEQLPLIRLVVSPNLRGFIRVNTALNTGHFKMVIVPFGELYQRLRYSFASRLCHRVYLN